MKFIFVGLLAIKIMEIIVRSKRILICMAILTERIDVRRYGKNLYFLIIITLIYF